MKKLKILKVKELDIKYYSESDDYISLTDIASFRNPKEPKDIIKNWLRNRSTLEFSGLWEQINNPDFKVVEFDTFLFEAGSNSFTMSATKWIESTNAIGIVSNPGGVVEPSLKGILPLSLLRG